MSRVIIVVNLIVLDAEFRMVSVINRYLEMYTAQKLEIIITMVRWLE